MNARPPSAAPRLNMPTKLFYGFGSVAFGVKDNGFSYLLLLFYNQVVGLSAPMVGLAILIAMMFDAFLDPIVGQISDNWRSRLGRRHPFMYAAALPVAISYLALWNPPHWSHGQLFFYLIGVAIVIRTFITFYEIPSSALSAELTQDYDQPTSLLSFRYFFAWVGGLALYLITFSFLLVPDAHHRVGQTYPVGFSRYGLLASVIMFVAIVISALGTQRHVPSFRVPPQRHISLATQAREMIATWSNRSFLFLTLSGLATSMAAGLGASMNIYFNTYFWEFTSAQIATLVLGVFASAFIALFAAAPLSRRFGKRATAMTLIVLSVTIGLAPMLLRLAGVLAAQSFAGAVRRHLLPVDRFHGARHSRLDHDLGHDRRRGGGGRAEDRPALRGSVLLGVEPGGQGRFRRRHLRRQHHPGLDPFSRRGETR